MEGKTFSKNQWKNRGEGGEKKHVKRVVEVINEKLEMVLTHEIANEQ